MMYYVQIDEDDYRLKYDDWMSDDSLIYLLCIHLLAIRGLVKSHMQIYILNTGGALQSTNGYHHAMHCV